MNNYYLAFIEVTGKRHITVKITESRYIEMREEYAGKINWWDNVNRCIDWLYDRGLKDINSLRLRNWMRKAVEINKTQELKMLNYNKDKIGKDVYKKSYKTEPLWTPPV